MFDIAIVLIDSMSLDVLVSKKSNSRLTFDMHRKIQNTKQVYIKRIATPLFLKAFNEN